jgi:hypothetical protein
MAVGREIETIQRFLLLPYVRYVAGDVDELGVQSRCRYVLYLDRQTEYPPPTLISDLQDVNPRSAIEIV